MPFSGCSPRQFGYPVFQRGWTPNNNERQRKCSPLSAPVSGARQGYSHSCVPYMSSVWVQNPLNPSDFLWLQPSRMRSSLGSLLVGCNIFSPRPELSILPEPKSSLGCLCLAQLPRFADMLETGGSPGCLHLVLPPSSSAVLGMFFVHHSLCVHLCVGSTCF